MIEKEHSKAGCEVLNDVCIEMEKQIEKWGYQEHTFEAWRTILEEELSEMKTEVIVNEIDGYKEGVQVAAVMLSWLRNLKVMSNRWREIDCFHAGDNLKKNDSVEVINRLVYLFKGKRPFDYYADRDAKKGEIVNTKVKSFRDIMEGK